MTTTTATPGGHSTSLGLMSCVRESSPQEMLPHTDLDLERSEPSKKRRFHPFRNLRKIFRRAKALDDPPVDSPPSLETPGDGGHRSRSTSELLSEEPRKKSSAACGGSLGGGALSVSHDSVFTAEQRSTSSEMGAESVSVSASTESLSIQQLMQQTGVRAELLDVVRRRGRGRGDTSEDEEDLGLPRSPCNSPTTTNKPLKEHPTKSHSTCSDGSLLSMGSSEMDEDSFGHSRHSSKISLHDKRPSQVNIMPTDSELDFGGSTISAPLSHSAAKHKMSIRPKRTHGAPRRRRTQQQLPTTPEVNEESSARSSTPEGTNTRETISELYSTSSTSMSRVWSASNPKSPETQLKSASLPPGLALANVNASRITRSRSNARDVFAEEDEDQQDRKKDKEESFFGRFLARRSGKKKREKAKSEDEIITEKIETKEKRTFSVDSGIKVIKSGPGARQRIQPIDIPASPDLLRHKRQQTIDLDLPSPPSISPELSPILQTKVSTSPESPIIPVPSPRTILPNKAEKINYSPPKPETVIPAPRNLSKDTKIVKITGLSSYQQKVLSYNDETDLKSEDLISKSHSFRSKSTFNSSQESTSLPFIINSTYDTNDSEILSTQNDSPQITFTVKKSSENIATEVKNEVKIINTNSETVDEIKIKDSTEQDKIENKSDGITISCVNSQMQASVNTKSSNEVIVSISNPEYVSETTETSSETSQNQVSVTKVQFKNSETAVPEFLKIQLNKVDAKPVTNVVLSTSNTFDEKNKQKSVPETETDKENGEIDTIKRKSSSVEEIEIIDKDNSEEITLKSMVINPQPRKTSLNTPSVITKPFLKNKSNSLDLDSIKIEDKLTTNAELSTTNLKEENENTEVIMRRKSLNSQKKDSKDSDEPELMKVFARRSLKLKDSEAETLSQQVMVLVEDNKIDSNKRDSDKENDESPVEERKKAPKKEPLTEKISDEVTLRKPSAINNKLSVFGGSKYQRSVSLSAPTNNKEDEERKNKSFIEKKPLNFRSTHIINEIKKSEMKTKAEEIITSSLKSDFKNEDYVPKFKRIQQRKEEWELRAQQNMKKT